VLSEREMNEEEQYKCDTKGQTKKKEKLVASFLTSRGAQD